jgi:hypothetical protein
MDLQAEGLGTAGGGGAVVMPPGDLVTLRYTPSLAGTLVRVAPSEGVLGDGDGATQGLVSLGDGHSRWGKVLRWFPLDPLELVPGQEEVMVAYGGAVLGGLYAVYGRVMAKRQVVES